MSTASGLDLAAGFARSAFVVLPDASDLTFDGMACNMAFHCAAFSSHKPTGISNVSAHTVALMASGCMIDQIIAVHVVVHKPTYALFCAHQWFSLHSYGTWHLITPGVLS